jgi:Icc-related predicted phosphoesterase
MAAAKKKVRIAAVGDIHCNQKSQGTLQALFGPMGAAADVLVLCGDLTDFGLPEEAQVLAKELTAAVKIPVVTVLGNHDYHAGKQREIRDILTNAGIHVLQGENCEIEGVGFAGVKGFGGGFGRRILEPWGEDSVKAFVREAVNETLQLEFGLSNLRVEPTIAILHYAPIQATVEGEPLEIYPFMGSSRLEEPLNRYPVAACFHGHAHRGSPEGKTLGGVPVYNVALPLMRRTFPDRAPVRIFEVSVPAPEKVEVGAF